PTAAAGERAGAVLLRLARPPGPRRVLAEMVATRVLLDNDGSRSARRRMVGHLPVRNADELRRHEPRSGHRRAVLRRRTVDPRDRREPEPPPRTRRCGSQPTRRPAARLVRSHAARRHIAERSGTRTPVRPARQSLARARVLAATRCGA